MEKEPPVNVERGARIVCEFTDAIGHHKTALRIHEMDTDGVYEHTITGKRFLPWEALTDGEWEVDE